VEDLGGAADGADLHDRVEDFYVTKAHRFIPSKVKNPRRARIC
jgi:hypothetical protein